MPHQPRLVGYSYINNTNTMKFETEQFLFAKATLQGDDVSFLDIVKSDNLNRLATQLIYLNAMVSGGKMSPTDAEVRVKDLYKQWKASNKQLKDSYKQ